MMQKLRSIVRAPKRWFWAWHNLHGGKHLAIALISIVLFGLGSVVGDLIHNPRPEEPAPAAAAGELAPEVVAEEAPSEPVQDCKSG